MLITYWVRSALIDEVAAGFKGSLAKMARPVADGRGGHPVIFRRDVFPRITGLIGDEGGKVILEEDPDHTLLVPWPDAGDFEDIDTPEDLARLKD